VKICIEQVSSQADLVTDFKRFVDIASHAGRNRKLRKNLSENECLKPKNQV
jgi:hypothetical protein